MMLNFIAVSFLRVNVANAVSVGWNSLLGTVEFLIHAVALHILLDSFCNWNVDSLNVRMNKCYVSNGRKNMNY